MILVPLAPSSFLLELRPEHFSQLLLPSIAPFTRSIIRSTLKMELIFLFTKSAIFCQDQNVKFFKKFLNFLSHQMNCQGEKLKRATNESSQRLRPAAGASS